MTRTASRGPDVSYVLTTWARADQNHRAAGSTWYANANRFATQLDPADPRRAAGVLAALSPRTRWERNCDLARRAYTDGRASGTIGQSCRVADRILAGEDPADVLKAPKVRAFFTLIDNPHADAVVIDRHAVDIAVGERLSDDQRSRRYPLASGGWYERFAEVYRQAAHILELPAHVVQAVTWLVHRDHVSQWSGMWFQPTLLEEVTS